MRWKWWNIVLAMGWRQWFAKIIIIVVESKWLELPSSCIFWQSHFSSRFLFHHFCIQKESRTSYSCKMKAVWNPLRPLSNKATHNQKIIEAFISRKCIRRRLEKWNVVYYVKPFYSVSNSTYFNIWIFFKVAIIPSSGPALPI